MAAAATQWGKMKCRPQVRDTKHAKRDRQPKEDHGHDQIGHQTTLSSDYGAQAQQRIWHVGTEGEYVVQHRCMGVQRQAKAGRSQCPRARVPCTQEHFVSYYLETFLQAA